MEHYPSYKKWLLTFGIFLGTGFGTLVSPIVHTLSLEYPDVAMSTIRSITTIPSLISFFLGLVLSSIVGKKISYRMTLILGCLFCAVGGVLPAVWNNTFTAIIISRVIFGLGFAVFAMRNAVVTRAFGTKESAKWMGYGGFLGGGVSMLLGTVSGILGDINWRYCFMLHALAIVSLLLIVWLYREKETIVEAEPTATKVAKSAPHPMIAVYFLITLAGTLCLYPFFSAISTFVADRGIGTAAEAGLTTSAYTLGGALLGLIFGWATAKFDRWVVPASCVIVILGYVLVLSATTSIVPAILGGGLCGAGFGWFMLGTTNWARGVSTESNRALSMTIISSAVSGGSFISSYFITFCKKIGAAIPLFETEVEKTFLVGIIIYAIILVLTCIIDFRPQKIVKAKQ